MITFHGERVQGKYVLFHTRDKDWMIHRMDPPVDPERDPFPEHVVPMLARLGDLPKGAADDEARATRSSGTASARSTTRSRATSGSSRAT